MNCNTVLALFFAISTFPILAATTAPNSATAAASQAATQPAPDWSTPESAYLTFYRAAVAQDGRAMQQSVAWEIPEDGERVALFATSADEGVLPLAEAFAKRFPRDKGALDFLKEARREDVAWRSERTEALATAQKAVQNAEVKINGDTAVLMPAEGDKSEIKFKKLDGKWRMLQESVKVPFAMPDKPTPEETAAHYGDVQHMRLEAMRRDANMALAKDIDTGKYATISDANQAISQTETDVERKWMKEEGIKEGQ